MHSTKSDNMHMDEKLLKRFSEPAWNYQVIRFLDAEGRDIIPRKYRIWTLGGVASRMVEALTVVNRPVSQIPLRSRHKPAGLIRGQLYMRRIRFNC